MRKYLFCLFYLFYLNPLICKGDNFIITSDSTVDLDNEAFAARCKQITYDLAHTWGFTRTDFTAKVHVTGKDGGNVAGGGATTMAFNNGQAFGFEGTWRVGRMDRFMTDVVPHEIFHILLALNRGQPTNRCWDEGFAQLTESITSQQEQWKRGIATLQSNRGIPLSRLITTPDYLPDIEAQYSQSYMVSLYVYNHFDTPKDALSWIINGHNIQDLGYPSLSDFHVNYMAWIRSENGIDQRQVCNNGQCRILSGIKKLFPRPYPRPREQDQQQQPAMDTAQDQQPAMGTAQEQQPAMGTAQEQQPARDQEQPKDTAASDIYIQVTITELQSLQQEIRLLKEQLAAKCVQPVLYFTMKGLDAPTDPIARSKKNEYNLIIITLEPNETTVHGVPRIYDPNTRKEYRGVDAVMSFLGG